MTLTEKVARGLSINNRLLKYKYSVIGELLHEESHSFIYKKKLMTCLRSWWTRTRTLFWIEQKSMEKKIKCHSIIYRYWLIAVNSRKQTQLNLLEALKEYRINRKRAIQKKIHWRRSVRIQGYRKLSVVLNLILRGNFVRTS